MFTELFISTESRRDLNEPVWKTRHERNNERDQSKVEAEEWKRTARQSAEVPILQNWEESEVQDPKKGGKWNDEPDQPTRHKHINWVWIVSKDAINAVYQLD